MKVKIAFPNSSVSIYRNRTADSSQFLNSDSALRAEN